ncbi:hypothetical protein [Phenylobacterium sp.]|uniref:hypothetical protein n=1 Tax=Phenylobacterium sp. TaxID=1871053 RepID=UPI002731AE72|nr:hypothetical protein [Phenylobacterium sp.]MDP1599002.1 hypothetical protein [Phenylobacterium sp.]MDP3590430.1 hypothetical protein [Phenylobacterium sp.]
MTAQQTAARTIRPTASMVAAVTAKQLSEVLIALRNTIEGNPQLYGRQTRKLDRAERAIFDRRFNDARELMADMQQGIEARDQAASMQAAAQEQEALSEARGAPTSKTETGVATRDGWLWLVNKGRYSAGRVEAGRRFREKFSKATDDSMKSCLADGAAGAVSEDAPCSHAARSHARFEIEGVQRHMQSSAGLASGSLLFERLVAVVGRGETVRQLAGGKDREAEGLAIELGFALDLAGVYLGAVRS